jgi:hypothetical protein
MSSLRRDAIRFILDDIFQKEGIRDQRLLSISYSYLITSAGFVRASLPVW